MKPWYIYPLTIIPIVNGFQDCILDSQSWAFLSTSSMCKYYKELLEKEREFGNKLMLWDKMAPPLQVTIVLEPT